MECTTRNLLLIHYMQGVDIISMSLLKSDLYVCSADGSVKVNALPHFMLDL